MNMKQLGTDCMGSVRIELPLFVLENKGIRTSHYEIHQNWGGSNN